MDEINETLIAMAAENYADSLERRGCAFWQGLYRGYIAGYRACEGKESQHEIGNCIKPDVKASALEKLKIAKKALNDIYNFDRDMEFEYGDPGERAMRALEAIDRIDGF